MSDQTEQTNQETTNATTSGVSVVSTTPVELANDSQDDGRDYEAEIKKLREEAAKWRVQYRDAEKQVKELSPAAKRLQELEESQKSEEQKLRDKIATMEAATKQAEANAERANKEAKLIKIAASAGVSPDLAALLDISKLDRS